VAAAPGLKFGVAFRESSGKALIRHDKTDDGAGELTVEYARRLSCGHVFMVVLKDAFPTNVLNRIKSPRGGGGHLPRYVQQGRRDTRRDEGWEGVLGVIDGVKSKGVETEAERKERQEFLRKIGYKR